MQGKQVPAFFTAMDKIRPVYDWTYKIFMFICKVLLVIDIVLTCIAVAARYIAATGLVLDTSWCEQIVLTCMIYMAVLSAALAIRKGSHIRMTALDASLPVNVVRVLDIVADLAVVVLAIIMIQYGMQGAVKQMKNNYESLTWLSRFWMYFPIPLAGIAMILFELESLYGHVRAFFVPAEAEKKEA